MREETKSVLGIAFLRTRIIAIFTLISYLLLFFYSGIDKYFTKACLLLFGFYAVILFVLFMLNKKHGQNIAAIYKDNTVRKTTGILILISGLISLFVYIPADINAIAQIIKSNIDSSVIPNIVSATLIICQILIAIYLLKCKIKTNEGYIVETVLGVAYLHTIITFTFSLADELSQSIISHASLNEYFLLRFVPLAVILLVLYGLNKKRNQSTISIFNDNTARKTTGVLIIVDGLISISIIINTVINIVWLRNFLGGSVNHTAQSITQNIVRSIIFICQILLGLYLLKYYKTKPANKK